MGNVASKRKRSKTIKKPIPEPTPEEDSVTNPASQSEISGNTYWLPNHYEELDRLSSQHFALKILYDGNFSKVIKSDMDCATVLDLGCGPGTWLMDVATEFPSSQFHGIDLFDIFPTVIRPPNVHFQVHDALKGLPFPDNTFDIVNTRMFILAVKKHEWSIVFKEILRVLKPGGFIQSCECSIVEAGTEFIKETAKAFEKSMLDREQDPFVGRQLDAILQSAGFDVLEMGRKDIHLASPDPLSKEFLWNLLKIWDSGQNVLCRYFGCSTDEEYAIFKKRFEKELLQKPEATWTFFRCVAQKRE